MKYALMLLCLTIGTAAAIKTVEMMNAASEAVVAALP